MSDMLFKRRKISIIGAGFVGSTCAHWAATKELGDIVLLDINEGAAKGKALDLYQSSPIGMFDSKIQGTANYKDIAKSDVIILTAGLPRKPGMSRDELLSQNAKIVKNCCLEIKKFSPESHIIVISNPLDAMAYVVKETLNLPRNKVIGMAGVLDSARFRTFISEKLQISVKDVNAFVLGGHGDTMVPMPRHCSIGGVPLSEFLEKNEIDEIIERTRKGGAEIVSHLKNGSAYFAPSKSAVEMAEAILKDQNRIMPCAAFLQGEYNINDLFIGVLCLLNGKGMDKVIEVKLNSEEQEGLNNSTLAVKNLIEKLQELNY